MRMSEFMTDSVQPVKPTMAAADAWELMRRKGIHHLVVTEGKEIVGLLSDRDVGSRAGAALRTDRTVADLMSRQVVIRSPSDTVRSAANAMRGRTIGCMPIVDRGRLVGIVTVSDLLELLGRGVDRPAKATRAPLHWRVPHQKRRTRGAAW